MSNTLSGAGGLLQNYDYQTPSTGFSYTFTTYQTLLMNPAATLATGTITMPASPTDGMIITFLSSKQITALTVNANTGQTIVGAATSMSANGSQSFVYRLANTTWFPLYGSANSTAANTGLSMTRLTSTGTSFTVPAGVSIIRVTAIGGAGGCGCYATGKALSYPLGGYGGASTSVFSVNVGDVITPSAVGAGGSNRTTGGSGNGGTGGTTSITVNGSTISATGGAGGNSTTHAVGSNGSGSGGNLVIGNISGLSRFAITVSSGSSSLAGNPNTPPSTSSNAGLVVVEY